MEFKPAMPSINKAAWVLGLFLTSCQILTACHRLPKNPHLPKSVAMTQKVLHNHTAAKKSLLADALSEQERLHPALSGYYPIATGANAFAARSILANMASQTIDAQYYIWHDDEVGQAMFAALWAAAEKGAMVRLLLDDLNGNAKLDTTLSMFASHPNIAVRLINPLVYRHARGLDFVLSPERVNRRMHNKSMVFDNRIAIIGGRNIGNEYLNNHQSNHFADLDVLLVGKVVPDITKSFDAYWQSSLAYDIETLVPSDKPLDVLGKTFANSHQNVLDKNILDSYRKALSRATLSQDLLQKKLAFRWADIGFLADDVSKLNNQAPTQRLLVNQLRQEFGVPKQSLSMISSYFVPTKEGVQGLIALQKQGVQVQILTNSYDATDVGLAHTGYADWRKALLAAGVRLFELKSTAKQGDTLTNTPLLSSDPKAPKPKKTVKDTRLWRTKHQTTTSLHAKAFAIDDQKVFIGSYNIDPRSANLNTEMGVMIYDKQLARRIHEAFNDNMKKQAYERRLNQGKITWHTLENQKAVVFFDEPNMGKGDRLAVWLMSYLPIEWLL